MFNKLYKNFVTENNVDKPKIDYNKIPRHVAIIMDGNGRWANSKGLTRYIGHRKGADVLKNIVIAANSMGIKALTVYGFSTENWKRPAKEVSLLMSLIKEYLLSNIEEMHQNGVRIRFIGYIQGLNEELQSIIKKAEDLTSTNTGLTLQLAINYGGRDEITRTFKNLANDLLSKQLNIDDINEEYISKQLDTREFSDVDLLIRPSGDYRISNFLLWQLAYAEFWFTDKHWPEFTPEILEEAILAFQKRERRFGGLVEE